MNTRIKDIACCERPYEKAKEYGISSLSDAELLSIIIRTGTRQYSSIDVSNMVLNAHPVHKGLVGLNYLKRNELINLPGIGDTKATELLAVALCHEIDHLSGILFTDKADGLMTSEQLEEKGR